MAYVFDATSKLEKAVEEFLAFPIGIQIKSIGDLVNFDLVALQRIANDAAKLERTLNRNSGRL